MRKAKKKSFNWYGMKQHFSIRKYHFGAASVLLGMSLVMGAGAQTVKAEETAASSDATTASSTSATSTEVSTSTEEAVASTSSLTIDAQTVTDQERIATINYIVTYVLEDGTVVNASIETATINTTEEVAKTTIPVYVELPAGYELATGQSANVTQEVVENGQNVVTVKVVKKVETTSSTAASVSSAAVTPTSTTENVSSSTTAPTTVEEAKTVLEQVSSEAELLANEANRLVAADSTNEALKTVAVATKLSVSEATVVLNESTATLESVNAQINAVRSNVEALVLELRKYSENGDIVVMLATTSSTSNLTYGLLNQGPGSDFEILQTSGQGAIADGFTVSPDMDDPAGATITRPIFTETAELKNDPTAGRYTFLVSNLDPYALVNETASRQNLYMTVSRDMTDPTNTDVYVRIVNKDTQILLGETVVSLGDTTKVLNGQIANVTISVPNPATNSYVPHTLNFTATYEKVTLGGKETDRLEFYYGSAESPDLRTRAVWQSNGLVQKGDPVHKLWSYVPKIATQTTYYRVQGTDELIATYVISGLEGDKFTSSTQRDVTNYEYVSGAQESGQISEGYAIGTTAITVAPSRAGVIERRVKTFVSEDGDIVITIQRKAADADDSTYETVYTTGVLDNLKYWTAETTLEGYDATRPYSFPGKTAFWTLYNEFAEANVDTTFYYIEKGSVEVFYVDENGNPLQDSKVAIAHGDTGSGYDTTTLRDAKIVKDGVTYYYKNIDGVGNAGVFAATTHADDERAVEEITAETGTVASNTIKELTYVYVPAGHVNINYVNEAGDVIKAKVVDTVDGEPGTTYDATQDGEKPNTIVAEDGKTYTFKEVSATSAATTGEIEAGVTKEVIYVYEEVKGNVVVNYITTDGTVIQAPVNDTTNASTGTTYDTTDNKPTTITTADGKSYRLVPALTIGNEKGEVVVGTTEVTYVYEEIKGDVVVNYVNTDGEVIAAQVVDTKTTSTGTAYDTTDHKPNKITTETDDVYYYKEVQAGSNETGKVVEGTTEVTYVYEKAGNVVVNYTLADGTVIKDPVNDETNAEPGSTYTTTDNKPETITTADGKVYKLVPTATVGNEDGQVEAGKTIEVTYIYEEVKSDVVVEYYDTEGNVIAKTVTDTDDASVGTVYNTDEDNRPETITTADGTVYYYKEVKDSSAPTTGTVAETTTTVQYVYEQAGNVVVNYIAEDGTVIKAPVNDETNAEPGTEYNTADNKPTTITTEDGKTYELIPTATIGTEEGTVEAGKTTEVTYVYKEVKGSVVVNYVTTDGTVLQAPVTDTPETSTGTAYDTTDNKPTTITTADGKTYRLVPKLTVGNEDGTVVAGVTEITYVYEEVKGDVVVNYVNTDGKVIATPVVDTKATSTGTAYDTTDNKPEKIIEDATGDVYYYKEVQTGSNETGKVVEGTTEVTYVYEKAGNVVVNYITEDGTVIKTPVNDETNAKPGSPYDTTDNKPKTITTEDGTTYELVRTDGNENGSVEGGKTTEVTYVYRKVEAPVAKTGNVVVEYYNTAGEKIAADVEDTPETAVGTVYETLDYKPTTITKDGVKYYYKEVKATSATEKGAVTEGTTTVQYVYEPGGSVTVNYVTTDGAVIKSPVKDEENAEPGKSYTTEDNKPTTITTEDGKTYKLVPNATTGDENGTITSGEDKQVTYVYEEVKGNVVVNYIDTEGNVIKTPVEDTKSASTGTAYDTTDNKPTTITTEDGTVYEIVPVLTIGSESGSVVEGTTQVTYVYRKVSTPTPAVKNGTVVVNYVTEDGTVIKSPVTDTPTSPEGTSYDTTDNKPTEITTEDGSRYVLIPSKTIGSENGTVVEGETVVTYVYKKVANWIPQIPSTPENPTPVNPVVPYPFDPTNPDKPVDPTTPGTNGEVPNIPYVPGYTPVDPKGNTPLKPVDPNDPGKGYVPPTPDETGKDTPIPYVQNGNVVVNYVTEDGTVIKSPVNDETDAPAGKSYDTTDNKPKTITTEDGTTYELVRVDGSENGKVEGGKTTEVTYVYRKVTPTKKVVTNHVDEEGNPIAPQEEGTTPNKSIPGYEFTGKTITDEDGNTTHIYKKTPTKKVVTNHVDEEGNPIAPQEEGTTPDKSIPGYEFTGKTITDEDGNTTHIYKKTPTKKVVTNHVDEEGNVISPQEDGTTPNKGTSIPGYEYVRTVVDVEGNTTHIYRKVSNKPTPPATETPVKPQPATPTPTADKAKQLPNTGEASSSAGVLGAAMLVAAIALAGKRRRNED
ncbi:YSIRK signal domain/LPXTG anchor domain surface protein [Streptococcus suis]|nr:YSIRK signal domain/LPXTG anchor domain surface protein [Streptococcus suis]